MKHDRQISVRSKAAAGIHGVQLCAILHSFQVASAAHAYGMSAQAQNGEAAMLNS